MALAHVHNPVSGLWCFLTCYELPSFCAWSYQLQAVAPTSHPKLALSCRASQQRPGCSRLLLLQGVWR